MDIYKRKVSENAFQIVTGILFATAIITAATRMVLQLRVHRRLRLDDVFLLFACVSLTVGTVLDFTYLSILYFNEALVLNPSLWTLSPDVLHRISTYVKLSYAGPTLAWTTIYFVKFAYLHFFRQLVDRVQSFMIYWKYVVGTTVVSYLISVISTYVACPKRDLEAVKCLEPKFLRIALGLAIFDIGLDIITDMMIIALPVCLLWNVNIQARQKVFLGVFLCLNIFMAITACVRVSGLHVQGKFDDTWFFFWLQIEASIAVSMISLTAFRFVFVSERLRPKDKHAAKPWYSSTVKRLRSRKIAASKNGDKNQLPTIPSATMTGLQTFIRGGPSVASLASECTDDGFYDWPTREHGQRVEVSHTLDYQIQQV